jgi:hypothetical protein
MIERTPFRHVPYSFSDIFDLSYEYWATVSDADEAANSQAALDGCL